MRAILVDPAHSGVIYAGVGGVYKSVNGGASWAAANGGLPAAVTSGDGTVSAFVIDHSAGDPVFGTVYAATAGSGVFRSTDGGLSWTAVNTGLSDQVITSLAREPVPQAGIPITLFAGTSTGNLFRSDSGTAWAKLGAGLPPGDPITALSIEIAEPRILYAALSGAAVYASANGGFSFFAYNGGFSSLDVTGLAVDGTKTPHALYASTLGRGMHDLEITGQSPPALFVISPGPPFPISTSTPSIAVTGTFLDDTNALSALFWSTNRGHAGFGGLTGGPGWAATVPLEAGLNVITITAVDTNVPSNEGSTSFTVFFTVESTPPTVTITTPTSNPTFAATATPLAIGGTASDNVGVTQVTWANSRGGSGTASGTTNWTASVPLQTGSNVITVTARDAVGNMGTDVITVSLSPSSGTFTDVPPTHIFFPFIEAIAAAGITSGCSATPPKYCPDLTVKRDQMAVFLLKGKGVTPPPATGTKFTDVPLSQPFAAWIEELANEKITTGCGATTYCPDAVVTRDQMAVFLLRAKHGAGYVPPAVGPVPMFADVPASQPFAPWIEELAKEGITGGCGGGNYCPGLPVTRGQMAKFLTLTFNLPH